MKTILIFQRYTHTLKWHSLLEEIAVLRLELGWNDVRVTRLLRGKRTRSCLLVFSWILVCGVSNHGCDRKRTPSAELVTVSQEAGKFPAQTQILPDPSGEVERQQRLVLDSLASAAYLFGKTAQESNEARERAYEGFCRALENAKELKANAEVAKYQTMLTEVDEVTKRLAELAKLIKEPPALPEMPDKPVFEKPEYDGTWLLTGEFRGRYKDGIVVQRGNKYYIIEYGRIPPVPRITGFVVNTGGIEILDIGRDGQVAEVVRISDRESYNEDQADYRKAIAEAKETHAEKLKEYYIALQEVQQFKSEIKRKLSTQRREEQMLQEKKPQLLMQVAKLFAARNVAPSYSEGLAANHAKPTQPQIMLQAARSVDATAASLGAVRSRPRSITSVDQSDRKEGKRDSAKPSLVPEKNVRGDKSDIF